MGFATAERFAKEGFQVVLAARSVAKTQGLAERLISKGYKAHVRKVDSSDPNSVAELVDEVQKQHGSIDVLHYNAASMRKATLSEQPRDSFNGDLAVNIGGALVAAQAVAPKMEEQRSGAILLTGGGFALAPSPDYLSISIGKAGIRALAHGLFEPFREKGIHVATVTIPRNRRRPHRWPNNSGICTVSQRTPGPSKRTTPPRVHDQGSDSRSRAPDRPQQNLRNTPKAAGHCRAEFVTPN